MHSREGMMLLLEHKPINRIENAATTDKGRLGRDGKGRFSEGNNANPSGMARGTKQRATKIKDTIFQVFFDVYGDVDNPETMQRLQDYAKGHKTEFLKIVASLLPKDITVEGDIGKDRLLIVEFGKLRSDIKVSSGDAPSAGRNT